ncbi:mRNA guanylyltransferase [Aureococcus anophagefferens]|nr:mRNA guanylyltransferase [Aureococcus anophagefferens]
MSAPKKARIEPPPARSGGLSLLENLTAKSSSLTSDMRQHKREVAAKEGAEKARAESVLRGVPIVGAIARSLGAARARLRDDPGAVRAAAVEVGGSASRRRYAALGGGDDGAGRRYVASRRGCGAVPLDGCDAKFCPGVSEIAFRDVAENLRRYAGKRRAPLAVAETVESTFGSDESPYRLVVAAGSKRLEKKAAVDVFDFAFPSASYDLRLQTAGEAPAPWDAQHLPRPEKPAWTWRRVKKRCSYVVQSGPLAAWRVDCTEVTSLAYPVDALTTDMALGLGGAGGAVPGTPGPATTTVTHEVEVELAREATALFAVLAPIERCDSRPKPSCAASPTSARRPGRSGVARRGGPSGSMPCGFARRHVTMIQREPYFVAEKSDGERRLLVGVDDGARRAAALVDRKAQVETVRLHGAALAGLPPGAILDGEVVQNLATGAPAFLVFDVLHDGRRDVSGLDFEERFFGSLAGPLRGCLAVPCPGRDGEPGAVSPEDEDRAFADFGTDAAEPPAELAELPVLRVVPKRFVPPKRIGAAVLARVSRDDDVNGAVRYGARVYRDGAARFHLSDGLVFVPGGPYVAGTDPKLLKWKWTDGLTVDLEVRGAGKGGDLSFFAVDDDGDAVDCSKHVALPEHDAARLRADVKATPKGTATVAELGLHAESGLWEYHGFRPDKATGNHLDVFLSTLLLHAESPSEHELEYRLRTDDPTKDDFAKRMDAATRAACSPWQEHFSKSNNRPYWWNSTTNQKTWEKPPGV